MATVNGPVQNRGQIRWWYSVDGYSASADFVTVRVDAYFYQHSWTQEYNGSKSWSGTWGSGSAGQAYFLTAGQQVKIVTTGGVRVQLTGSARTIQFSVSTSHFYGATSHTLSVPVPARYASTPTNLKVTRNSDVSHLLQWSRQSTYSSVVVQRRTNGGAWTQVARPSGNAANWTDTTTRAGNKYDYRVAGVGGGGQSGWSNTATVYTSPSTPSGVSATRNGNNIVVDVSGKPAYATGYNIRDGATQVASNVQLPWTHVNPAAASTHTYTVQAVRGSLTSGWSSASNTVQLISQPLAPTGLAPNGAVSVSDTATVLKWKHNPVDSSAQSAGEARYRVKGVTAWTTRTVTTAQQFSVALDAAEYEWQVRTKGAHPDWSPWSAIASATVIDRPGVAVTQPGEVWTKRTVTATWSWSQDQSRPQSAWEAELHSPDGLLERRVGSGAGRSVAFTSKLVDGVEYETIVKAATGDVWSDPAAQSFYVQVPPAAPGDMSGVWSEESGAVTVDVQDGRGVLRSPITNHFPNPRLAGGGATVEVRRNRQRNPRAVSTAHYGTNNGAGSAGALSIRASNNPDGTGAQVRYTLTAYAGNWAYLMLSASAAEVDTVSVTPGQWVAVRARVFASAGSVIANIQFRDGATFVSQAGSPTIPVTSWGDEGTTVTFAAQVPAGANRANLSIGYPTGHPGVAVGAWVQVAAPMVVVAVTEAEAVARADLFFSAGMGSPDPDMTTRFLGAENGSESVLEAEPVRGVTGSRCLAIRSTWEGQPAIRIIPTNTYTQASDAWSYASVSVPAVVRGGGLFLATLHVPAGTEEARALRGLRVASPNVDLSSPAGPGSFGLRCVYGELTSSYAAQVWHGGAAGTGDLWVTGCGFFTDTAYPGAAFDGASGLVQVDGSWMGASWGRYTR